MPPKSVLITGCSEGGVGDALAREFRSRGLTVFATGLNVSKLLTLELLGIHVLELDVTSESSVAAAAAAVRGAATTGHGTLDILVNNAEVHHIEPFLDTSPSDNRRVLETNVVGPLVTAQAFAPLLIRAKGVVDFIGSVNTVFNPPYQVAYNASRAAVGGRVQHAASRAGTPRGACGPRRDGARADAAVRQRGRGV